jgi:hypothetical protein
MSNVPQGSASNIIVGPARLLVAPSGTALPTLDGTVDPVTFVVAWQEVGYTDQGVQLAYTPGIKDIMVDEEMATVKKILDSEKCAISTVLAEATMKNLKNAISASILTQSAADVTHAQLDILEFGSGTLNEVMVALEGLNQAGKQRIVIAYRAVAEANVQSTFKRNDKTMWPLSFGILADSTKTAGKRLIKIVDLVAPHS